MRSVISLLGVLITLLFASANVSACTCGSTGTPCESFGSASAVFVGTPISVSERPQEEGKEIDWNPVAVKFSVEQSYLGVPGTEIDVFTGRGGGDCGYRFKVGQRYLVYASQSQNKTITTICSRTRPFSEATEDLAFLGTLATNTPGVTIQGQVTRERSVDDPIGSDLSITIEGESERKEIRTDAQGRFRVSGLRAGKYKVSLAIPETLSTWQPQREVTVSERGCGTIVWYITDNGRIGGRVIDADGQPVAGIMVSLLNPDDAKEDYVKLVRADDLGRFKFSAVPRGRYLMAVNRNRYRDPKDPTNAYPATYYPGVVDQTHAQPITVGAGEKLNDLELKIPSKRPASILNASVVWSDGSPVANALLSVSDVTQSVSAAVHDESADDQGRFRIDGYVGQKLLIRARSNRPYVASGKGSEPMERSEGVMVTLQRPTESVRIVITKLR